MKNNTKDWIQYSTAIGMIVSGIILAFLSFFLNHHDIESGVLMYVGEALVYAGGIFGVSLYFKTKLGDFEGRATSKMESDIKKAVKEILKQEKNNDKTE